MIEFFIVDHPGRGQVMSDFGLSKVDDGVVFKPCPQSGGDDAAEADNGKKGEDELGPQGEVEESFQIFFKRHMKTVHSKMTYHYTGNPRLNKLESGYFIGVKRIVTVPDCACYRQHRNKREISSLQSDF